MVIVRAPVRISFGGGGTDLAAYYTQYGGFVISAAIARYCYVIAREPPAGGIFIRSSDYQTQAHAPGGTRLVGDDVLKLPKAAIAWFQDRGQLQHGVDVFLAAEVPPGSGLGSSSAMAVALVHALAAYTGALLPPEAAAALACQLEIDWLDMPIGKQDQYASAFGGLNTIAFRADQVVVQPLPLAPATIAALRDRLLLFSTGQTRESAGILRQQRTDTQHKHTVVQSLHQIKWLAGEMYNTLVAGELDAFGHLLDRAWHEKRQLSGNVSTTAIDTWYSAALAAGAIGGKITGAGGGGFLLLYCPPAAQANVRATLTRLGLAELPFDFDHAGAQVLAHPRTIQCAPMWDGLVPNTIERLTLDRR